MLSAPAYIIQKFIMSSLVMEIEMRSRSQQMFLLRNGEKFNRLDMNILILVSRRKKLVCKFLLLQENAITR